MNRYRSMRYLFDFGLPIAGWTSRRSLTTGLDFSTLRFSDELRGAGLGLLYRGARRPGRSLAVRFYLHKFCFLYNVSLDDIHRKRR